MSSPKRLRWTYLKIGHTKNIKAKDIRPTFWTKNVITKSGAQEIEAITLKNSTGNHN